MVLHGSLVALTFMILAFAAFVSPCVSACAGALPVLRFQSYELPSESVAGKNKEKAWT